jgi:hypothetical protein
MSVPEEEEIKGKKKRRNEKQSFKRVPLMVARRESKKMESLLIATRYTTNTRSIRAAAVATSFSGLYTFKYHYILSLSLLLVGCG